MSPPRPTERVLNPAHAILAGAVLSAIVTLVGVTLNIRSSERLSTERGKRDAAVSEAAELKDKVGRLEKKLDEAVAKIPSGTTPGSIAAPSTLPPLPPQSIVVVITMPTRMEPGSSVTGALPTTVPATRTGPSSTVAGVIAAAASTTLTAPTSAGTGTLPTTVPATRTGSSSTVVGALPTIATTTRPGPSGTVRGATSTPDPVPATAPSTTSSMLGSTTTTSA